MAGQDRTLELLNSAPDDEALRAELAACCAAGSWVTALAAGRPFADRDELFAASDAAIAELTEVGFAEALAAHPRIGERASAEWSRQEQSGMASASADLRAELVAANAAYEQRFGQVYLVCATGRTAEELLASCRSRLGNDQSTERAVVLAELAKISRLRLGKLLDSEGGTAR
jgi:2-oxo-4-hydroxy-4-carboxy-5-ureidoimidazoline decarboxylase